MADNSDSRESDNNSWVIAGSEALPVEDIGSEVPEETKVETVLSKESQQASIGESEAHDNHLEPEESKRKGPEVALDASAEETPSVAKTSDPIPSSLLHAKETSAHHAEERSAPAPQGTTLSRKAVPLVEEPNKEDVASKEHDVEGLRRRKGQDVAPVTLGAPRDRGKDPQDEDGSTTKWFFGFLALLALALLVALGVILDTDESPGDTLSTWSSSNSDDLHPGSDGKDWPSSESLVDAGQAKEDSPLHLEPPRDTQSLDAMGLLLDKLAKENQDIRLMQAELQAQKEELQALLLKTEGEALEFTSQQQSLATENSRLKEALQREKSSLLAVQAELRLLQEKMQGLGEAGEAKPQPQPEAGPVPDHHHHHKPERQDAEIRRLHSLLTSVGHDVAKIFQKVPPGDGAEGLRAELSGIERKLAQEIEGEEGARPLWKEGPKTKRGKEKAWHRKHEGLEEHRRRHHEDSLGKEHKDHRSAHKVASDAAHRPRKHQGMRDAKPAKEGEHQRGGRKAKKPTEPSALWEILAKHQYQVPQGCNSVAECARQEGLAPVQKATFLKMVHNYLSGLGWAEHYGGLVTALDGFFGNDGAFAHDRFSFVDFLDEIEDALEELAELLGGSEEEADNFEEVVLRQLGASPGGRFAQRDNSHQHTKDRNREGHSRKNGRENPSRASGQH
ncbi:pre-B-cell leukemia transcription factor-interacting protein 1 [Sceloporus undulatus]|uniref:pre-B-cell leukemia transcription factor-interacting protein 1 n=1 Tax=Sceloporus undulatus TaxID=8520 RepID=UPI001C4BB3EA|nr:pre-B-cell leukemia transcription factor-interacting protein 1 [Sceloporus undulatus]